ncbi:MAG: hypothetical protein IJR95_04475 [Lachnospiraceae bacterium]|nr:hypothetical protein [Lachnospiraceae bacterium]
MNDLISRQAAIDAAVKMFEAWYGGSVLRDREIRARFDALPSAQPEIIRCKDCKYSCIDPERESDEIYCSENDFWRWDDFYCGFEKRREDE